MASENQPQNAIFKEPKIVGIQGHFIDKCTKDQALAAFMNPGSFNPVVCRAWFWKKAFKIGNIPERDDLVWIFSVDHDGSTYQGQFKKGTLLAEGLGKRVHPDGSVMEGYWKNNWPYGECRFIRADGSIHHGEWSIGNMVFNGTITTPDGKKIERKVPGNIQ